MTHHNESEIRDRLLVLKQKEETTYRCGDYMKLNKEMLENATTPVVDDACRSRMCQWCYQVIDFCGFQRETAVIAISNLDRFMATPTGRSVLIDQNHYQLAFLTCLHIAIKGHESLMMDIQMLVKLSRSIFSEKDFNVMELTILKALGWRINGPTPLAFVHNFIAILRDDCGVDSFIVDVILEIAQRHTELAIMEYKLSVLNLPSEIALAAVLNAFAEVGPEFLPFYIRERFFGILEHHGCLSRSTTNTEKVKETQTRLSLLSMGMPNHNSENCKVVFGVRASASYNLENESSPRRKRQHDQQHYHPSQYKQSKANENSPNSVALLGPEERVVIVPCRQF